MENRHNYSGLYTENGKRGWQQVNQAKTGVVASAIGKWLSIFGISSVNKREQETAPFPLIILPYVVKVTLHDTI